MSLPTNTQITNDSVFTYASSGQGRKKTRVTASTLLDNVAVYSVKTNGTDQQFITLQGNKKQDKFTDNIGTVQIGALLKPVWDTGDPNRLIVGAGASADTNNNDTAAQILVNWQNTPPVGCSMMTGFSGSTTVFNTSQIPSDYYIFFPRNGVNRYSTFEVQSFMIGNAKFGEVETFVELHLIDNNGNLIGVVYDTSKSGNDQGGAWTSIANNTFYMDLNNYPGGFYLLPLIKFSGAIGGQVSFTIGDPKTDAAVSVDEI
ncbi:MAG TPA: hypothetical protein PKC76_17015 [Saprospiraceae bacterium]|nr:hypothetical protein [Saprospiraceae bacterium]HMP25835.1 hypothetical protein [Saprospiraceae bacterium]